MHQSNSPLLFLSISEIELLTELVLTKPAGLRGVEPKGFRAKHYKRIPDIEGLLADGLIRTDGERYLVSLIALPLLNIAAADSILETAEALIATLKIHYLRTQTEAISISALAKTANVTLEQARDSLAYMLESPSWRGGYALDIFSNPLATLNPSEGVLVHDTFKDAIAQISKRKRRDQNHPSIARLFHGEIPTERKTQKPDWVEQLPPELSLLMNEVYGALEHGLLSLCAMGIRASIDMLCIEWVGDIGGFEQKLSKTLSLKKISDDDYAHISTAIEVGNASAHRGHAPSAEDSKTLLAICERILYGHYILPTKSKQLQKNTPPRRSKKAISTPDPI